MSLLSLVLLVLAAAAVLGAEWPRLARQAGIAPGLRHRRERVRRKSKLRVVRGSGTGGGTDTATSDADDFVESVRRDLERLPTFDRDADRDS